MGALLGARLEWCSMPVGCCVPALEYWARIWSELVWIAHCWVWVFWVTLEVDKSVLELMSLWVRSFVLGIAKDSCRSNFAHHPLPLFNTLDSFPRTQMPIHFNKVFKSGNGNFYQLKATSFEQVWRPRYLEEVSFPQERALMTSGTPENDQSCVKSEVATKWEKGGGEGERVTQS